jgi:actin-related protein
MKGLFDPCVNKIVDLIQGQIQQVERTKNRVKNVFLVGGFGESPYLQQELKKSLDLRKIKMRRPDEQKS